MKCLSLSIVTNLGRLTSQGKGQGENLYISDTCTQLKKHKFLKLSVITHQAPPPCVHAPPPPLRRVRVPPPRRGTALRCHQSGTSPRLAQRTREPERAL